MGPEDAGRRVGRRGVCHPGRHRRSQARGDLRRQLWRLRDARGSRLHARALRLRRRLCGRVQPVHFHGDHPALLEADARHDVRDGRRSREGQGSARSGVARAARRQDPRSAPHRTGRAGSARQQGGIGPDGGRAECARHRGRVSRQRERRTRLPERGEPLRVLRGHGALPRQAPAPGRLGVSFESFRGHPSRRLAAGAARPSG